MLTSRLTISPAMITTRHRWNGVSASSQASKRLNCSSRLNRVWRVIAMTPDVTVRANNQARPRRAISPE